MELESTVELAILVQRKPVEADERERWCGA
jgi:hypothetical protein